MTTRQIKVIVLNLSFSKNSYKLFRARLRNHSNPLIMALNSEFISENPPRLKENWNRDLK